MYENNVAKIKVIGVGGGGGNAVSRMFEDNIQGVDLYVANTDLQALSGSKIKNKIVLGEKLTSGLGAGGNPDQGKKSALESEDEIRKYLEGTDMLFVAAGMGGGTGTGAAPVIAKIAKDMGILTIAVVTKPFMFEGKKRQTNAARGLEDLKENVDSLIIVPNDKILSVIGNRPFNEAFAAADMILRQGVQTITDLVAVPAYINLDFADVEATLKARGAAMFGIGRAKGENKAKEAALKAVHSPLLESSIKGCTSAIVNVTGGSDVTLLEVNEAVATINEHAGDSMDIIFGFAGNDKLQDEMIVTIIATGYEDKQEKKTSANSFNMNHQTSSPYGAGYETNYGMHESVYSDNKDFEPNEFFKKSSNQNTAAMKRNRF